MNISISQGEVVIELQSSMDGSGRQSFVAYWNEDGQVYQQHFYAQARAFARQSRLYGREVRFVK
jgi:hypothetical protein